MLEHSSSGAPHRMLNMTSNVRQLEVSHVEKTDQRLETTALFRSKQTHQGSSLENKLENKLQMELNDYTAVSCLGTRSTAVVY